MMQDDYVRKLDELDTLLNDPDVPMDPARVWSLLADLADKGSGPRTNRTVPPAARPGATQVGGTGN
jgi:hypothetical protein